MEAQIATTTALLKASAFLVFILVRAAMDIFSHGVHIYIPVYHWDENSLWLPSPKVVVFSQKEASMLICGENVHSCCVQRRAQTHVKRFHTFACDAVGLQCWVGIATNLRWLASCWLPCLDFSLAVSALHSLLGISSTQGWLLHFP